MVLRLADLVNLDPRARADVHRQLGRAIRSADAPSDAPATPAAKEKGGGRIKVNGMNKWEAEYARRLEAMRRDGSVLAWGYECVRLRIGKASDKRASRSPFFTPDFYVVRADGRLAFHEVKGFFREAARVRVAVAAGLFPHFPFVIVGKRKGGGGRFEVIETFNGDK